jgi:hypothetical protein
VPFVLTGAALLNYFEIKDLADQYLASGPQTDARAEQLLDDRSILAPAIGQAGGLALALLFIYLGLNAMRVGLLSRFMGILGVIVGVLIVIPLLPEGAPVVEIFWLGALGVLFLGRWPGGRGPAWESGEPIPWPTAADRAELAAPPPEDEPPEPDEQQPQRRSRKRRRR